MSSQQVPKEPSVEDAIALFKAVEEKFPKALGEDKWYLVVVGNHKQNANLKDTNKKTNDISQLAALCGGGHPDFAATLYSELIKRPEYEASESRKALMRRLREALVKLVSIIGVCRPLDAIFEIEAVTKPEDKDYSFSRFVLMVLPSSFQNSDSPCTPQRGLASRRSKPPPRRSLVE